MKIGLSIPNNWGIADARELIEIGVLAEELGFHSLWTSEHLVNVSYVRDRIGNGPYYSALSILSALAVRTSRVRLGTSILVLPFHNPFFVAKYFATLDHLSEGRATLGVGIGNVPEEFEALGIPWGQRGALTDEAIDIIRTLWSRESADHDGVNWAFGDVHTAPKPFGASIPISIGGISPAALRRTARVGDDWQALALSPGQFRMMFDDIRRQADSLGRDSGLLTASMRVNIAFDGETVTESERKAAIATEQPDEIRRVVEDYRTAGATDMLFALNCRDPGAVKTAIKRIAKALPMCLHDGADE
ncbi:TIGR03619 family F420-dependent LLM class oxidoreductase [Sphingobium mellinum]|uniref:TIGR03619 family F420-dependent LLM class oxidoreductase n=1 Tax=Sphingobium mellinum TaxID=1387166 RepID=UPI0030EE00A4